MANIDEKDKIMEAVKSAFAIGLGLPQVPNAQQIINSISNPPTGPIQGPAKPPIIPGTLSQKALASGPVPGLPAGVGGIPQQTLDLTTPPALPQVLQKKELTLDERKQRNAKRLQLAFQLGIPAVALGLGGARGAGLATGFAKAEEGRIEHEREMEKEGIKRTEARAKQEAAEWDDAYDTALALSKTGALGGIKEMTPEELNSLAEQVYEIKYADVIRPGEKQKTPKAEKSEFKSGDKRNIDGVTYIRNEKGIWEEEL